MSQDKIPFQIEGLELTDATPIPIGKYNGIIEGAKIVEIPNSNDKLWIGVRITGPKQANRYITTLLTLDEKAASAYKTASLIKATAKQLGETALFADPNIYVGLYVGIDVTHWTPRNTGVVTAEIRSFFESNRVADLVAGLASNLSMDNKLSKDTNEPAF